MNQSHELSKKDLLEKTKQQEPTVDAELPSGGNVYPESSPMSKGFLTMRYMRGEDEEILISPSYMKKNKTFDVLLKRLVLEHNFDPLDLTVADKEYLILSARVISLGDEFESREISCNYCEHVHKSEIMHLSDIKENPISVQPDEKGKNEFTLELPQSGHPIKVKVLTGHDQKEVQQQFEKSTYTSDGAILPYSVAQSIVEAPGVDPQKFGSKLSFYNKLPLRDTRAIREHLGKISGGTDFNIDFTCSNCGREQEITIDFNIGFFF